jgi:D-lactate dehydrogenase
MVVKKYDGSLKAEHGTGRNMAPFVELEWGTEAYELMKEIKNIFDPENVLNPGVILNSDRQVHIRNLKPLPAADPIIDKCIECGFCEVHCPSKNLTITPRQRIAVYREIARLMTSHEDAQRLSLLRTSFAYEGDRTCATDGLCATSCPVGIDTGKLIKELRFRTNSPTAVNIAATLADNMGTVTAGLRAMLNLVHVIHNILGTSLMRGTSSLVRKISGNNLPLWNACMPKGADPLVTHTYPNAARPTVVYFPTCINRVMGIARGDEAKQSLTTTVDTLLEKAGYNIVHPEGLPHLCCGMAFASKGFKTEGDRKASELESALTEASEGGTYPVLVDMSPCLYRMKETFTSRLMVYEPIQFTAEFLVGRLNFRRIPETIAIHNTCSSIKMGLDSSFLRVAELCAAHVIVPHGIECCGWAGDRGFTVPELNASALKALKSTIPPECHQGYSTSRTCEIGLSMHSGIHYQSILYLVDKCTTRKELTQNSTVSERYAHSQ